MSMGSNPMFPNILYNYSVSYVINQINIASSHKKLSIKLVYTKKTLNIIKILKKNNFIHNFLVLKDKNSWCIKAYPFYFKNLKIIKSFKLVTKPSRTFFISLRAIHLLSKRSGSAVYLISTSRGVMNHLEALEKKISGFLVGFYYL